MAEIPADEGQEQGLVEATLSYLARAIVSHPDDVTISTSPGEGTTTIYRLHVNPEDMGRIIGRHGRTARAIRQITRAAAAKSGASVMIEIVD